MLEGLIVTIQVVRLQYYEFFSKFFTETGEEFTPFTLVRREVPGEEAYFSYPWGCCSSPPCPCFSRRSRVRGRRPPARRDQVHRGGAGRRAWRASGGGIAVGQIGAAAMAAMSENPELSGRALPFVGLAEGICLWGFIVALMILSA